MEFHTTRWSLIFDAADSQAPGSSASMATLLQAYWRPLYVLARVRGLAHHDAEDAVQGFLLSLLEQGVLKRLDPARGRFRSFLGAAMQNFLANRWVAQRAMKRGGGFEFVPLSDAEAGEIELQLRAPAADPALAFDREWAGLLLDRASERVRCAYAEAGHAERFRALRPFLSHEQPDASYECTANALGVTAANARVLVHRLRAAFRQALREEVAATVTAPHEVEEELQHLRRALA